MLAIGTQAGAAPYTPDGGMSERVTPMAGGVDSRLSVVFKPGVWLDFATLLLDEERRRAFAVSSADRLGLDLVAADETTDAEGPTLLYSAVEQFSLSVCPEPVWTGRARDTSRLHHAVVALVSKLNHQFSGCATISLRAEPVLRVYDFNVGSVSLVLRVDRAPRSGHDLSHTLSAVTDSSARLLAPVIGDITRALRSLADPDDLDDLDDTHTGIGIGVPLYGHALYTPVDCEGDVAVDVRPDDVLPVHADAVHHGDFTFAAGHQGSTLVGAHPQEIARVAQVVDLLHAWWTAVWALDEELLRQLHAFELASRSTDTRHLSDLASDVAYSSQRVDRLRSRFDSLQLNLGGLEWTVWQAQAGIWEISNNLAAMERKQQSLQAAHTMLRTEVEARQNHRFGRIAAVFTVATTVASVIAVWVFLIPTITDVSGSPMPRVEIFAITTALGVVAVYWSYRAARIAFGRRHHPAPAER
jgi:hypothetical protein